MNKVLIADDEAPIREWIQFCIEKNNKDFQVVGIAANGEEALDIFKQHLPEIVFSDIIMPVRNGIDLLKQIKLINPSTEVIILSSHSNFDFARDSIKYGAAEYVLKTEIDAEKISELLDRYKPVDDESNRIEDQKENIAKIAKDNFIRGILAMEEADAALQLQDLDKYNIHLANSTLFALSCKLIESPQLFMEVLVDFDFKRFRIRNPLFFSYSENIVLIIGNITGVPSFSAQTDLLREAASQIQGKSRILVGVSPIYNSISYLRRAISEAIQLLDQEFYNTSQTIFFKKDGSDYGKAIGMIEDFRVAIIDMIKSNDTENLDAKIDELMVLLAKLQLPEIHYVKSVLSDIIRSVYFFCGSGAQKEFNFIDTITEKIMMAATFEHLKLLVKKDISDVFQCKTCTARQFSQPISRSIQFIENNYTKDIGLSDVAAKVLLNPEYFSRLFKEETGTNFSAYLASLRLNKAVELLRNSSLKVYEISEAVGYHNLSYFSKVFKKKFGINPFEFRNIN